MKFLAVDDLNLVRYSVFLSAGQIGEKTFILCDELDQPVEFRHLDVIFDRFYESCSIKVTDHAGIAKSLKVIGVEDG